MIIVVKILIWIGHEREEFQNDGRGHGWMKIDFFRLLLHAQMTQPSNLFLYIELNLKVINF